MARRTGCVPGRSERMRPPRGRRPRAEGSGSAARFARESRRPARGLREGPLSVDYGVPRAGSVRGASARAPGSHGAHGISKAGASSASCSVDLTIFQMVWMLFKCLVGRQSRVQGLPSCAWETVGSASLFAIPGCRRAQKAHRPTARRVASALGRFPDASVKKGRINRTLFDEQNFVCHLAPWKETPPCTPPTLLARFIPRARPCLPENRTRVSAAS